MKKIFFFLPLPFLLTALSWLHGCGKDPEPEPPKTEEEKLPPATEEGRNTLGCLVDGKAWLPKWYFAPPGIDLSYDETSGHFQLFARNDTSNLRLNVLNATMVGGYQLLAGQSYFSIKSHNCAFNGFRKYADLIGGNIRFTKIDFLSGTVSGIFSFIGKNTECGDSTTITKGRFDIKYK